jgi:hypothetical protein
MAIRVYPRIDQPRAVSLGLISHVTLSGASGKSCGRRQEGNAGWAVRPTAASLAPNEGMAVGIPVDRRAVDRIDDLVPGLEAHAVPSGRRG